MHIRVIVLSFNSNKYYSLIWCVREFWTPIWKLNFGLFKFEFESKTDNIQYHSNLIMTSEYMHIIVRVVSFYSNKYCSLIRCVREFWTPIWKLNFGLFKFEFESKAAKIQYHSNLIMTLEYMDIRARVVSGCSNKYYSLIWCGREFWTPIWKLNFGLFKFEFEFETANIQYSNYLMWYQ